MYVLRELRRDGARERLSELRGWLRAATDPARDELEERQFSRQRSGQHEDKTPAGRFCFSRALCSGDQGAAAAEAVKTPNRLDETAPSSRFARLVYATRREGGRARV